MNRNFKLLIGTLLIGAAPVNMAYAKGEAAIYSEVKASSETNYPLHIIVAQSEIKTDINSFNAAAAGGGLLGGIIAGAINSSKAKKAETLIAPVRDSIVDLDIDALAIQTAKTAFAKQFAFADDSVIAFGKDSTDTGKSLVLDGSDSDNITFVEYKYDFTPNFGTFRLFTKIDVAPKAMPANSKGEKRLKASNLSYSNNVATFVDLSELAEDKEGNVALWAADNGKLTREAIALAFAKNAQLTARMLDMKQADFDTINDKAKEKLWVNGIKGRVQNDDGPGVLIWSDKFFTGYLHSQKLD